MNMNTATPTFASAPSIGRTLAGNSAVAIAPSNSVGPSRIPARISPTTAG
jgi:hypothetical protein